MKNKRTHFTHKIRIRKSQLEWIRKNKTTKTMAGQLDIIINKYKHEAKAKREDWGSRKRV